MNRITRIFLVLAVAKYLWAQDLVESDTADEALSDQNDKSDKTHQKHQILLMALPPCTQIHGLDGYHQQAPTKRGI